ncbi:MAG: hypothetical protein ACI4ED_08255, partial [Suilimivivens sp.]
MEIDLYDVWIALKGKMKKYRVFLICLIELVFLMIYGWKIVSRESVDCLFSENEIYADTQNGTVYTNVLTEETSEAIQNLRTEGITLDKGIYDITVEYRATNGGTAEIFGQTLNNQSMWCNTENLVSTKTEASFQVWINDKTNGLGVSVKSNGGELVVDNVRIKPAWNSELYLIVCLLVKICFVDLVIFGILFRNKLQKYSVVICGILGITFLCSVGLFTRYLVGGHDMVFHMNRIEGFKDGLLSGTFPVRIQPTWNNGWGYAVSVMYGDLTLVFPALMRVCGFTLQTTWKAFIVAVNFATAVISFYSFHKICKDKYKALFSTLIYCTGLYRLACIYVRAAVGEFTVMVFLPLVVLGFWYAFGEDLSDKEYGKKLIAPVIGFTGMIQTHVLTCEMSALFIIVLCIIMIKKVFRRKTFLYLVKIVVITAFVNMWFLVPFIKFFGEDLVISRLSEMRDDFQTWGLSVTELFATTASHAYGFTFGENVSLANKCTFTLGLALWACAAIVLLLLWNKKVERPKTAMIPLAFGIISAFMTTNLFPYEWIKKYIPFFAVILSKIQFSYRFLGLTGLFFTLAVAFVLMNVQKVKIKRYFSILLTVISVLTIYQGMDYQYQILYGGAYENIYCASVLDTTYVVSGEYLYENSSVEVTNTDREVTGSGVEVLGTQKKYLDTSVRCKAYEKEAYIEIPVFYYPGYVAVDDAGKSYKLSKSADNNRIRVDIPEGFEGTVYISYQEPLYWRICEIISLISFIGLLGHRKTEKIEKQLMKR